MDASGDEPIELTGTSFEAFVTADGPKLRRALVGRFGVDVGVDVTADALAYAWAHWDDVSQKTNPVGFLFRVGQSAARRYRRAPMVLPPVAMAPSPDHDPALARALERLTARQRAAVILVCVYDWTYPMAAAVLGLGESSVRNHVRRGLASLRRQLGEDDE